MKLTYLDFLFLKTQTVIILHLPAKNQAMYLYWAKKLRN